jgi:hypothetical protein
MAMRTLMVVLLIAICGGVQGAPPAADIKPASSGYATAAEGLRVYYGIYGKGDIARVIEAYLDQPTSKATQFSP